MTIFDSFLKYSIILFPAAGIYFYWQRKTGRRGEDNPSYPVKLDHSKDSLESKYIKYNYKVHINPHLIQLNRNL